MHCMIYDIHVQIISMHKCLRFYLQNVQDIQLYTCILFINYLQIISDNTTQKNLKNNLK